LKSALPSRRVLRVLALAAAVAAAACSCDLIKEADAVPGELQGVWAGSGSGGGGVTLTFTANSFTYSKTDSYTIGNLKFSKAANPDPFTREAYPSGYRFEGACTAGTGNYAQYIGEKSDEPAVFLNKEKNKLCQGGENSEDWIFTRK
jgi:hypothetical protein